MRVLRCCLPIGAACAWLTFVSLAQSATLTVLNNADSGGDSLRERIAAATSGDTIVFDAALNGQTILLTSGELVIPNDLTILGPGANLLAVNGNGSSRVFNLAAGNIVLDGLTITNGQGTGAGLAAVGGGIFNLGTLTVNNCTVSGNKVTGTSFLFGGGIYNGGSLSVNNCTISGNSVNGRGVLFGGGIYNRFPGPLTVNNCTISGNLVLGTTSSAGGGIGNDGTLIVNNCTISSNSAVGLTTSGGGVRDTGTLLLRNSIVAGNTAAMNPDLTVENITSNGHNFVGVVSGPGILQPGDQTFASSGTTLAQLLGPLADHGGPTPTHALLPDSPALNAGLNSDAAAFTSDQRGAGFPRVEGGTVDIGAFEFQTTPAIGCPSNLTVECTGGRTVVNFSVPASNDVGPVAVTCTPPSGTGFRIGTSNVVCTASNSTVSCSFTITVQDTQPPILTCPSNITVEATSVAGAVLNYVAGAVDPCGIVDFGCSPPSGSTFPIGVNAVTCTASDPTRNTNSCTFFFTVNASHCPIATNLTVSVAAGSSVNFQLPAGDSDGNSLQYAVTQAPQHGTLVVQVQTGAATYSPNSGYCGPDSFKYRVSDGICNSTQATVTINVDCGLRSKKQQVLADLIALRAITTDHSDREHLEDAIDHIQDSLANSLWVDDNHLVAKKGKKVFDEEEDAVDELKDLREDAEARNTIIPEAVIQDFIDRLVQIDRALAVISVDEAEAAGANPKKIKEDREEIEDGDENADDEDEDDAIKHYRDAWAHAVKLKVTGLAAMPSPAGFRLHFAGIAGEQYILEVSSDFVHWTPLADITADANGNIDYTDANAAAHPSRFYRVVQP